MTKEMQARMAAIDMEVAWEWFLGGARHLNGIVGGIAGVRPEPPTGAMFKSEVERLLRHKFETWWENMQIHQDRPT